MRRCWEDGKCVNQVAEGRRVLRRSHEARETHPSHNPREYPRVQPATTISATQRKQPGGLAAAGLLKGSDRIVFAIGVSNESLQASQNLENVGR